MDTFLIWLMLATALLLVFSMCLAGGVLYLLKKLWHREPLESARRPNAKASEGCEQAREDESAERGGEDPVPRPRDPASVQADDLSPGDVVYVVTVTGSQYAFTLKNAELRTYHLRGSSASRRKSFDMDVIVDNGFTPGKPVMFWSLDREWHALTTPTKRILVDRNGVRASNG